MARVHHVEKNTKEQKCGRCQTVIAVGAGYRHATRDAAVLAEHNRRRTSLRDIQAEMAAIRDALGAEVTS